MRFVRAALQRCRALFRVTALEHDLTEELDAHLQLHVDDNLRVGMSPGEARRRALIALGGIETVKEHYRRRRGVPLVEALWRDLRFGARLLKRQPAFTLGAVAALTIGTGANVLVFSLANALVLRPLPIAGPHDVVRGYLDGYSATSYRDYVDYRDRNRSLSGLAIFSNVPMAVRTDRGAETLAAVAVSGNYFDTLGVPPAMGRMIAAHDDAPGAPAVVVLSHSYWQRRFGANVDVIGRVMTLNSSPFVVIGVAPRAFTGTEAPLVADAWLAWHATGIPSAAETRSGHLIGRLRPDTSLTRAQLDVTQVAAQRAQDAGTTRIQELVLFPAHTPLPQMAAQLQWFLAIMAVVAGIVLLVACVNLAGLLLARAEGRRREIALRLALGASRWRIWRQLMTESVLLAGMSAATASTVVIVIGRLLARVTLPIAEPVSLDLVFDWRVTSFTVGLSAGTVLLFGLMPAIRASGLRMTSTLKGGSAGTKHGARLRRTLLVAQIAMSTLLLVGAGVLLRSLAETRLLDLGLSTRGILTAGLGLSTPPTTSDDGVALVNSLRAVMSLDPRVQAVSVVGTLPLTVSAQALAFIKEGAPQPAPGERLTQVFFDSISPGYFDTVQMVLIAGRDFSERDTSGTASVVIVNELLASRFWPGENPIGKRLHPVGARNVPGAPLEVVGVARNAQYATVGEAPKAFVYFPLAQSFRSQVMVLVRSSETDPLAMVPALRAAVMALAPDAPLSRISSFETAAGLSTLPLRVAAGLTTALGLAALVLAAIGIYAMTMFIVRQRTRELGIRLALGAAPSRLVRDLTRETIRLAAMGIALGVGASFAATSALRGLLHGVTPTDPMVFTLVPAVLLAIAYLAGRLPAGAASRVSAVRALRDE